MTFSWEVRVLSLEAGGFRGPRVWYTNGEANIAYASTAHDSGRLSMPVLFVNGGWELICSIKGNEQGNPLLQACTNLTLVSRPVSHWLPQERSRGTRQGDSNVVKSIQSGAMLRPSQRFEER